MNDRSKSHVVRILLLLAAAVPVGAVEEADLLIAYDNSYADSVGGDDNVEVGTANSVAAANAIGERSGTPARLRIGGYHKTSGQSGRSTLGGYVGWMANYGDGNLDDVTVAADARGADLVTFICAPVSTETSAAVAQQPGRYSAFGPGNFWNNVVAHEIGGHNYGCDHKIGRENPKTIMLHNYCGGGSQGYFSNPNIWLGGQNLQGIGSCLGDAVDGGDAAYKISTTAGDKAEERARPNTGPMLDRVVRRWRFDAPAGSAPNGTTLADEVSGSALATVLGNGAVFTGDGLRLPGGVGGSGAAYIELPTALVSGYTNVTIEIWATPLSARNWSRILDINDHSTANYLMLSSCVAANLNTQRFESRIGGTAVSKDSSLPTVAGVAHHYTITFADNGSGGGRWRWYRDGDSVAYVDVATYTLATMPDTKAWLGRSVWSSDDLANCDYMEVRISDVAMTDDQVLANYRLGMDWDDEATVRMTADNALGTSSFNSALHWSDGLAPSGAKHYEAFNFKLRTPATSSSYTFAGNSLKMNGGELFYKSTAGSTITVNNLILGGRSTLFHAGAGTWTIGGNMTVNAEEVKVRAKHAPINISANMGGDGAVLYVDNNVALSGNNSAFTGKTIIGDGRYGELTIDSEARLGANPAAFATDQLSLNRAILHTSATMAIDDANRGIRLGVNGGQFDVASGTTLTLAVPLSNNSSGNALQTAPLNPDPVTGPLGKQGGGTLVLTHPNNSQTGGIFIDSGELAVAGSGRLNNGNYLMPIYNNGVLRIGTSANQTLGGALSGGGQLIKEGTGTLILQGNNYPAGTVAVAEGVLQVDSTAGTGAGTTVGGGTLAGTGTVGGPAVVQSGGTVAPGPGIGTLSFSGNLAFQSGSAAALQINQSTSSSDTLDVAGTLTLGGVLVVENLAGTLANGDQFTLFEAGVVEGTFDSYSLPALAEGLAWNTNAIQTGILSVYDTGGEPPPPPPVYTDLVYVDATSGAGGNTTLANGNLFNPPLNGMPGADNNWKQRTTYGSAGNIFESGAEGDENAPELRTTLSGLIPGATYKVYINIWSPEGSAYWCVRAGFNSNPGANTIYSRSSATPSGATAAVLASGLAYSIPPTLYTEADRTMYAGLLGPATADINGEIHVYVDDLPSFSQYTRSWYDGLSHSRLLATNPTNIIVSLMNDQMMVSWPENHEGWTLQHSTNLVDGTWEDVGGTTTNHAWSVPEESIEDAGFFRIRYPIE